MTGRWGRGRRPLDAAGLPSEVDVQALGEVPDVGPCHLRPTGGPDGAFPPPGGADHSGTMGAMPARRRIPVPEGRQALDAWRADPDRHARGRRSPPRCGSRSRSSRSAPRAARSRCGCRRTAPCSASRARGTPAARRPTWSRPTPRPGWIWSPGARTGPGAEAAGVVRASGQRAVLSAHLPLFGGEAPSGHHRPDEQGEQPDEQE